MAAEPRWSPADDLSSCTRRKTSAGSAPDGTSSSYAPRLPDRHWAEIDLIAVFAEWMAADEYRDAYFECPEDLDMKLDTEFTEFVVERLRAALTAEAVDKKTVVGVFGAASLYGFTRLSDVPC